MPKRALLVLALVGTAACQPTTPLVADVATPVQASYGVTVDPTDPALHGMWQQPVAAPATVTGGPADLQLTAMVHREALTPSRIWVELFFVSARSLGLRDVVLTLDNVQGAANVYDFTRDPFAAPRTDPRVRLGNIAPEGVGRVSLGFDSDGTTPIRFSVALDATTTRFTATSSAPLALSPDDRELWVTVPDADVVAVVDTSADRTVATVPVAARPRSFAITPTGDLVLVVSSDANVVSVIDRARRRVVQTLGEPDGIGRDARFVVVAPDGGRAWVSAYVGDRVTALERHGDRFAVAGQLAVGRRPTGMAVSPDGKTLYVAHFLPRGAIADNEAWVSVVDTATLAERSQVVFRDGGNPSEVRCLAPQFGLADDQSAQLSFEGVPNSLAGVFLAPGGDIGYVPAMELGPIPIFEGDASKAQIGAVIGANTPPFVLSIDARDPASPQPLANPGAVDLIDDTTGWARCARPRLELEFTLHHPLPDDANQLFTAGATSPSFATPLSETGPMRFIGFSRGGRRAFALSHSADEIVVFDAVTQAPTTHRYFPLSGSNPTGIVVSADGRRAWVSYDNTLAVSVLDVSAYADPLPPPSYVPFRFAAISGQFPAGISTRAFPIHDVSDVPETPSIAEIATIPLVDSDPVDAVLRRGKTLFDSSSPDKYPQLSAVREATCEACHPEGGNDGSAWSTMEGERRTVSLAGGVAGRGWLHQSATHKNALEFVTIIAKERLGGSGLDDDDAHAMAEYLARGIPRLQSPPVDAALAARGQALFADRCATCHRGPAMTSGNPDPADPYGGGGDGGPTLYDVGDASDSMGIILGPAYTKMFPAAGAMLFAELRGDRALGDGDPVQALLGFRQRPNRARGQLKAPSLVNVWDRVLFFHDGHATSLDAAVRDIAARVGAQLGDGDVSALVAYLQTL